MEETAGGSGDRLPTQRPQGDRGPAGHPKPKNRPPRNPSKSEYLSVTSFRSEKKNVSWSEMWFFFHTKIKYQILTITFRPKICIILHWIVL